MPWQHALPGARLLIDRAIAKAREHLDLREDFPVGDHGLPPLEELEALDGTVGGKTLPPLRYRIMQADAARQARDVRAILAWIAEAHPRLCP